MATWLEDIVTALANLGGVAHLDQLYLEVRRVRASEPSRTWQTTVRRIILDHSSDSKGFRGANLFYSVEGIGLGVWGLRSSLKLTPIAADIQEPETPLRALIHTYRVLRDTDLGRKLKALYKDTCQLSGHTLHLGNAECYSEVHHIRPLGKPHNGPDVAENIMVLCPNDHVLFDCGAIRLDPERLHTVQGHTIGSRYVQYHNNQIYARKESLNRFNKKMQPTRYTRG